MGDWLRRIQRALRLDPDLFEEVEHDHSAGPQAFAVVVCASLAGGVGNILASALLRDEAAGWTSVIVLTAFFLVAWLAWSFVMMAIGTTLFGGVADMGEMQRALGFAAAPGLLMILPGVGAIVGLPWSLVAMVIAVRQALDFSTSKALVTVAAGATVMALVLGPTACFIGTRLQ